MRLITYHLVKDIYGRWEKLPGSMNNASNFFRVCGWDYFTYIFRFVVIQAVICSKTEPSSYPPWSSGAINSGSSV